MKTIFKIIFAMTVLMCVAAAQVPLLNRVGTTIYPWRPGDKFSDSLLSANAALLNKNNVFTGANRFTNGGNDFFGDTLSASYLIGNGFGITSIPFSAVSNLQDSLNAKLNRTEFLIFRMSGLQDSLNNKQNRGENYSIGAATGSSLTPTGAAGRFGWFTRNATAPQSGTVSLATVTDTLSVGVAFFSGRVGIGTTNPSARLSVKASNAGAMAQDWYRSASATAIASIDTNGSVTFNNVANNGSRFVWYANSNGNSGNLSVGYINTNRVSQLGTDLQVGSVTSNGTTYFVAGLGSSPNNAFTFSSPSNGSGVGISSTGYMNVKATNQRVNIQEWYRSSSTTAVASVDTSGNITGTKFFVSSINADPINASDTGTTGEIRFAPGYIYVCTAPNTWKRVAISSW